MRWLGLFAVLIVLALYVTPACSTAEISTKLYLGLPAFGTYINFDANQSFSSVYRASSYWYFEGYGFQVEDANLTVNQFFEDRTLIFTVNASSGTSTSRIYVPGRLCPEEVEGATSWSWDWDNYILTVNVNHTSAQQVTARWSEIGWSMDLTALSMWFWVVLGFFGFIPVAFAFVVISNAARGRQLSIKSITSFFEAFFPVAFLIFIAMLVLRTLMSAV